MNFQGYMHRDPGICGGEPVIKGTRVTVKTLLASLAEGASVEDIHHAFPTVSVEAIRAVIAWHGCHVTASDHKLRIKKSSA